MSRRDPRPAAELVARVGRFVRRRGMTSPGDGVLVACSGGGDSVALAVILAELGDSLGIRLGLAHIDHGLRGEEGKREGDEVEALGARLGVPVVRRTVDVAAARRSAPASLQAVARRLRYAALLDAARDWGAEWVATAHTADDVAETLLLHLLRGAGPRGLSGPRAVREDGVIRPLLRERRADLRVFLQSRGFRWVEDPSNDDWRFRRVRVRRALLPWLERHLNPRAVERLAAAARHLEEESEVARAAVDQAMERASLRRSPGEVRLDRRVLDSYTPAFRSMVVRAACATLAGGPWVPPEGRVEALLDSEEEERERVVQLARDVFLRLSRDVVTVHRGAPVLVPPLPPTPLPVPGRTDVGPWRFVTERGRPRPETRGPWVAELDETALSGPLQVRSRRHGDRFRPLGGPGGRRLSDFMIDRRIPARERPGVPIVTDGEKIVWVVGHRVDERARADRDARCVVRITARRLPGRGPGGEVGTEGTER